MGFPWLQVLTGHVPALLWEHKGYSLLAGSPGGLTQCQDYLSGSRQAAMRNWVQ